MVVRVSFQTATKLVGWAHIVVLFIWVVSSANLANDVKQMDNSLDPNNQDPMWSDVDKVETRSEESISNELEKIEQSLENPALRAKIVPILASCIQIVVSVLLLVGVSRQNRCLMMPWIVVTAILSCLALIFLISGWLTINVWPYIVLEFCCIYIVVTHWKELSIERMIHIVIVKSTQVMPTPAVEGVKSTQVMQTPAVEGDK